MRLDPSYPVRSARLLLRLLERADASALLAYRSRPEVCRWVPFEPMDAGDVAAGLRGRWARRTIDVEGDALALGVVLAATDQLVGDVVLRWVSAEHGHGEVGYVFHPDYGGRGFATEAVHALLHLGFDQLGLHRVTARVDARNSPSARLATRVGMRLEATLVENEWFKGAWSDEVDFAMLEREWRDQHAGGCLRPPARRAVEGERDLGRLLASLQPRRRPGTYVFCTLAPGDELGGVPTVGEVAEDEGRTVVVHAADAVARNLAGTAPSAWITLEADSDLASVGLLAVVSGRLAAAGISCNVAAGRHHDHLFVPVAGAEAAMDVLRRLQSDAQVVPAVPSGGTDPDLRPARLDDQPELVALWRDCGLDVDPERVAGELAACLLLHPELVLVAEWQHTVVGSAWATFDGRRGWLQRLAVRPGHRGRGTGSRLVHEAERRLAALGATKVNLLVERENAAVTALYRRIGYEEEDLIFMERWLA